MYMRIVQHVYMAMLEACIGPQLLSYPLTAPRTDSQVQCMIAMNGYRFAHPCCLCKLDAPCIVQVQLLRYGLRRSPGVRGGGGSPRGSVHGCAATDMPLPCLPAPTNAPLAHVHAPAAAAGSCQMVVAQPPPLPLRCNKPSNPPVPPLELPLVGLMGAAALCGDSPAPRDTGLTSREDGRCCVCGAPLLLIAYVHLARTCVGHGHHTLRFTHSTEPASPAQHALSLQDRVGAGLCTMGLITL